MDTPSVLFKNEDLIAVSKPAGMPVQPDQTGDADLLTLTQDTTGVKLHLINRLDRPVSGIMLFTPKAEYYHHLQKVWRTSQVKKQYLAVTEGHWQVREGTLVHFLKKGKGFKSFEHPKGKKSILHYRVILELTNYSVLSVFPETGRFHQIRCQLAISGHPIKGDVKYLARRGNKDRSIHLHCYRIVLPGLPPIICLPDERDPIWKLTIPQLESLGN